MNTETVKCRCGLLWKLTKQKTSFGIRDADSLRCACGAELKRWNGAHLWTAELLPYEESRPEE
jgi:hypothetical protein